ncbi:hypothetical protein J1N35_014028, partial [Gossypium stocksii]
SHKNETPFKARTLPSFEDISVMYGKYHASRKDAQTTNDIIEVLEGEENNNGRTKNILDRIGVEEDGFNGTENVGFVNGFQG